MTTLAMNYIVKPFARIWEALKFGMELRGYAKAAEELRRLGYHKEADNIIEAARNHVASR